MTEEKTLPLENTPTLTAKWETMGVDDRPVEVARTMTMEEGFDPNTQSPSGIVSRRPDLVDKGDTDTLPELEIKGELGEGGMGLVELAEQLPLGRDVAVKKVREKAKSEKATLVLLREGWTTGVLEHPNVVPIYTLGRDDDGEPVIVMKKISGTSWLEIIEDPGRAPEAFDADDPIELHVNVLTQICNAVDYAHDCGIIHRDLKPDNVMLGEFGEVYLLDWGIAVATEEDPSGRLATIYDVEEPAGTPAYMAPEMTEGDGEQLGPHTDIFLLGAMLYEALTGEPPYSGETLYQIMLKAHRCDPPSFDESVPPELAAICRRAMSRDPDERFESARAFRKALADFREHRRSRELTATGDARLEEVERFLNREEDEQKVDERDLYKVFGECRFAYEQALEVNPDNQRATESLQRVLELMADRALRRDAYKAASLLISDFPEENPEFQTRLDELEERLDQRREDFEELEQIRRDHDQEYGRTQRVAFMSIVGLGWVLMSAVLGILIDTGIAEVTHAAAFIHILVLTAFNGVVLWFGRHYFVANKFNRKLFQCVMVAFGGAIAHRGFSWILETDPATMLAREWLLYGISAAVMAVALDRRIFAVSVPFVVAGFIAAIWPEWTWRVLAPTNVLAVGLIVALWWPDNVREELETPC